MRDFDEITEQLSAEEIKFDRDIRNFENDIVKLQRKIDEIKVAVAQNKESESIFNKSATGFLAECESQNVSA